MCCPEAVSSGSARAGYGTKRGLTGTMRCRIEADATQSRSVGRSVGRLVEYSTVSGYPNWNFQFPSSIFVRVQGVCVCVYVRACVCGRNSNGQF
jgi:hypothetical protein